MKQLLLLIGTFRIFAVQSHDSDSSEANGIEMNPFYDAVIFGDIADVINEFENNVNSPLNGFENIYSESDENIENLLSEYQHYLEKAHKQRKGYLEKFKTKNKVPLLRHERFIKTKPGANPKYDDYYYNTEYYNINDLKFPQTLNNNPLNLFVPLNSKARYPTKTDMTTALPKDTRENTNFGNILFNEKRLLNIPSKSPYQPFKSSCYCKDNRIPCECSCKQCLMPFESYPSKLLFGDDKSLRNPSFIDTPFKNQEEFTGRKLRDLSDNTLNIRIKVDVSLPKISENLGTYMDDNRDKTLERGDVYSKEFSSAMNLPYFNFPIPMEMFGYKKTSKLTKNNGTPIHKITIHKKKKSRINNNNKRHRKKLLSIHNIKLEPQHFQSHIVEHYNISENNNDKFTNLTAQLNATGKIKFISTTDKPDEIVNVNETQTDDSIYLMVNISTSNNDNIKEEIYKSENSIETDYTTKYITNATTDTPSKLRIKREILSSNISIPSNKNDKLISKDLQHKKIVSNILKVIKHKNNTKKSDKGQLLLDTELLYWPINDNNRSDIHSKNITAIILETEDKKVKLNISKETIRRNHTRALEQAVFGKIDWNDMDAVAPTFLSFVGKYLNGALTFCSSRICHSMKCADKTCVHRVCAPEKRFNKKGHCTGSNNTDSVASMESIMDLPSNIAFEIVDILQDKMLGKIYGKVTLCITSKCITFASAKKVFVKSKCNIKELTNRGHCPNPKKR